MFFLFQNPRGGDSYTSWKWDNMGNRKSVDNLFQVYRSGLLRPGTSRTEPLTSTMTATQKSENK
ncbi:hypothetical protein J6590_018539 [Homalodisca vitripennis]|nr:hypothetical protein J6590_018539 [Homalodisca vitripennis]